MAEITLGGTPVHTSGKLPETGSKAPDFTLVKTDLTECSKEEFKGKKIVLNIFPSVETAVCAQSVRQFNKEAAELNDTVVLCISRDLPFAQKRFCAAEGIEDVVMLSDFKRGDFGRDYGVEFTDGGFDGLLSRAVVVIDTDGLVRYTEQVAEIGDEPNYKAALEALMDV